MEVLDSMIEMIAEGVEIEDHTTTIRILVPQEGEEATAETEIVALHTEGDPVPARGRILSFVCLLI